MTSKTFIAEANLNFFIRQPVAGLRILRVFDKRDRLLDEWNVERALGVAVLSRHVTILAGLRS